MVKPFDLYIILLLVSILEYSYISTFSHKSLSIIWLCMYHAYIVHKTYSHLSSTMIPMIAPTIRVDIKIIVANKKGHCLQKFPWLFLLFFVCIFDRPGRRVVRTGRGGGGIPGGEKLAGKGARLLAETGTGTTPGAATKTEPGGGGAGRATTLRGGGAAGGMVPVIVCILVRMELV